MGHFISHPSRKASLRFLSLLFLIPCASSSGAAAAAQERTIHGVVRAESGAPVSGAQVTLLDRRMTNLCPNLFVGSADNLWLAASPHWTKHEEWKDEAVTRSSPQGEVQIQVPGENLHPVVLISADGFAPHLEEVRGGLAQEFVLEKGEEVRVQVLGYLGEPVLAAEVILVPMFLCGSIVGGLDQTLAWRQQVDADGRVTFKNLPRGAFAIRLVDVQMAPGRVFLTSAGRVPLVVQKGVNDFRADILGMHLILPGSVEAPPQAAKDPGRIVAYWKDPDMGFLWSEASFSAEQASFQLFGIPDKKKIRLIARTESGLSSGILSSAALEKPIRLRSPVEWSGRIAEELKAESITVQFITDELPPGENLESVEVPISQDGRFVIPNVSPMAGGARLIAPDLGMAEVRFDEDKGADLGVVRFKPATLLHGQVISESTEPLAGAQVEISAGSEIVCRTWTGKQGDFACVPAASGGALKYRVRLGEQALPLVRLSDRSAPTWMVDPGALLTLDVVRPSGKVGVEDLRIDPGASGPSQTRYRFARAPGGKLMLHLPKEGQTMLSLSNPEGVPAVSRSFDAGMSGKKIPPVILSEGPAVFGTVASAATRRPIEEASVLIGAGDAWIGEVRISRISITDGQGSWRQQGFSEGTLWLSASAKGYSTTGMAISVTAGKSRPQEIFLQSPGRIHGKVLGLAPGSSIMARARWTGSWSGRDYYKTEWISSPEGEFTLESVTPGRYYLLVLVKQPPLEKERLPSSRRDLYVTVPPGETAEVTVDLRKGIALSGEVRLGDKPVSAGARLGFLFRLSKPGRHASDACVTDDKGHYEVMLPVAGVYRVTLNRGDAFDVLYLDRPVTVSEAKSQSQDLIFGDGEIRGRVVDSGGRPLGGVNLDLGRYAAEGMGNPQGIDSFREATTGEDGIFKFRPLAAGTYRLHYGGDRPSLSLGSIALEHDQSLDLRDLVLEPATLEVLALGPGDVPVKATITAYLEPGLTGDWNPPMAETSQDGRASLKLSRGRYNLVGAAEELVSEIMEGVKVPREDPSTPLVVRFFRGGSLDVQIVDRQGVPIPDVYPQIFNEKGWDVTGILSSGKELYLPKREEGTAHFEGIFPGEYQVKVNAGGKPETARVSIVAGQTSQLKLTVETDEKAP